MRYDADWVPPWRTTEKARCQGINCTPEGIPGRLVMACTLNHEGLCRPCAQTADNTDQQLRIGIR